MHLEFGRWLVEFKEDYSQLWKNCNWYTFHFVRIEIEDDSVMGGFEATAVLLGLGIRVAYTYDRGTEMRQEIRERMKEIDLLSARNAAEPPISISGKGVNTL